MPNGIFETGSRTWKRETTTVEQATNRERVLIVEDDLRLAGFFSEMLGIAGDYEISIAEDNETAAYLLERSGFEAAFVDVRLKGETSERAAEMLLSRGIAFAFMTGGRLPDAFEQKFASAKLLMKPARIEEIRNMLIALGCKVFPEKP